MAESMEAKLAVLERRNAELTAALRYITEVNAALNPERVDWRRTAGIMREKAAAALAAAGEGEDRPPRSEPDPDQPFHPCACGGDHLTIDHPSGSRLPEPNHE
jgi:hypothetical protein